MNEEIKSKLNLVNDVFNKIIDSESYQRVLKKYSDRKLPRIILSGVGKNWYICEKVVKTYLSMGIQSEALDCVHALHGDLGMLMDDSEKLLIFVSKSGTTEELTRLVKIINKLRENGIIKNLYIVGFYLNTPEKVDVSLYDDVVLLPDGYNYSDIPEFDHINIVPSLSINTMQMVLDVFGVTLFEQHKELVDNYVYNHLGGSNGRRLGSDKFLNTVK